MIPAFPLPPGRPGRPGRPVADSATGLGPAARPELVTDRLQGRVLGFLGQESVNIVELNHGLARLM
ncbi:hypothetical protein OHT20_37395 [Streptomyces caniferus]|uniref:Uncharacterized protein n=1 Tax=Streptomyces caniferus TaxID=285557 RepID=A0A640SAS4_9ACTN|nr:hypothetical protein [Streptomyces caniferus]GFE07576.1 hypothetical protein Scani_38440 [Streptomyces caniferus]